MDKIDVDILLNQDGLIVINKPYDIPTSGKNLEDSDAIQYWLMQKMGQMIWAVHQLDADTTGVNLFVTEKKLVPHYQNLLSHPETKKIYLSIVHGVPEWQQIICTEPIGFISKGERGVSNLGKSAQSTFTVLHSENEYSLIQSEIITGRTHQIRIHLSHLGFPLVGEDWYTDRPIREHCRQALHAWKISFNDSKHQTITAPIPRDFENLADRLGIGFKNCLRDLKE